jgi:hypothetical protein
LQIKEDLVQKKLFKGINKEMLVWVSGIIFLAAIDPTQEKIFSLCFIHTMGFKFCPGCGLGKSVSYLLHGEVVQSFQAHPLGIFALFVLIFRIIQLSIYSYKQIKNG